MLSKIPYIFSVALVLICGCLSNERNAPTGSLTLWATDPEFALSFVLYRNNTLAVIKNIGNRRISKDQKILTKEEATVLLRDFRNAHSELKKVRRIENARGGSNITIVLWEGSEEQVELRHWADRFYHLPKLKSLKRELTKLLPEASVDLRD